MNYDQMASQLQSRVARRAADITTQTMWKVGFRALGRMKDWRETKDVLKQLSAEQVLDKRLLRMTQEFAYMDALMEAGNYSDLWLEGN